MLKPDEATEIVLDCLQCFTQRTASSINETLASGVPIRALGIETPWQVKELTHLIVGHPRVRVPARKSRLFEQELGVIQTDWTPGEIIRVVWASPLTGLEDTDEQ